MMTGMIIISDRTVRLPLFWDGISNCTNLFRPEPNQTRHRIFTLVSLLFGNLMEVEMLHIYRSMTLHVTYLPDIRTNRDVNQLFEVYYIIC